MAIILRFVAARQLAGVVLAAGLVLAGPACERRKPVDPELLAAAVGKRAFEFYRLINENQVHQATLFMSKDRVGQFADPLDEPLIQGRIRGEFDRALAKDIDVDYKRMIASVEVTRHRRVRQDGRADTLMSVGTQTHRWVRERGGWFYDGIVERQ